MKERPILFSGPMVQAILDGRKTQTRRVVNPQPEYRENVSLPGQHGTFGRGGWNLETETGLKFFIETCPYGKAGDRLWVRETHAIIGVNGDTVSLAYAARMPEGKTLVHTDGGLDLVQIDDYQTLQYARSKVDGERWRPSIFMPRWASRITLEITGVRVERLQDISRSDIDAEGVLSTEEWTQYIDDMSSFQQDDIHLMTPQEYMATRWDRINGKKHPWASNPWVWVVEFQKVEAHQAK